MPPKAFSLGSNNFVFPAAILAVEMTWVLMGIAWLHKYYTEQSCTLPFRLKNVVLGRYMMSPELETISNFLYNEKC